MVRASWLFSNGYCRYYIKSKSLYPNRLLSSSCARECFIKKSCHHTENTKESGKWTIPSGYSTNITIYNTLTKSKVPLILKNKSYMTWYMCGPTVYDSAHLGHACCYVKFDIIRRILENFFNINVLIGMSVTDIDDKIINRARELNEDFRAVSNKYETEFWDDMKNLNVTPPHVALKVSKHIDDIISFILKLIELGKAYAVDDGSVYFNISSYDNYGKLVPITKEENEYSFEYNQDAKKNHDFSKHKISPMDFALWKGTSSADEPGWRSPWGRGRPGWHIECSAMASKLFGSSIDLHSGGIDLIFPHHENEDAQSCSYHETPQWVNYWIYTGHLYIKGQKKMSKSLKNTLSIQDFLSKYTPNQFRMFCLLSHYHSGIEYTEDTLKNAVATVSKIESFLADTNACLYGQKPLLHLNESDLEEAVCKFKDTLQTSLADDFNTPAAMTALIELITYTNKLFHPAQETQNSNKVSKVISTAPIASVSALVKRTLENLGMNFNSDKILNSFPPQEETATKQYAINMKQIIEDAVEFRSGIRGLTIDRLKNKPADEEKLYLKNIMDSCDTFRQNMFANGVTVKDHGKKSSWSVLKSEKTQK